MVPLGPSGLSTGLIDVGRELSKLNRKSYSQGRMYHVSSIEVHGIPLTADESIEVKAHALPCNWPLRNSWVKAKAHWDEMNRKVLSESPSVKPKYHDFKVGYSTEFTSTLMNVVDAAGSAVSNGEWELSKFVMPQNNVDSNNGFPLDALENTAVMSGVGTPATTNSIGVVNLIEAYAESRARVAADSPIVDANFHNNFYTQLTDVSSHEDDIATNLLDVNDEPPYDHDSMIGDPMSGGGNSGQVQAMRWMTSQNPSVRLPAFCAPLGFIGMSVDWTNTQASVVPNENGLYPRVWITVKLKKGDYKGVDAPYMGA